MSVNQKDKELEDKIGIKNKFKIKIKDKSFPNIIQKIKNKSSSYYVDKSSNNNISSHSNILKTNSQVNHMNKKFQNNFMGKNNKMENKKLNKYASLPNIGKKMDKYNSIQINYDKYIDKYKIITTREDENQDIQKRIYLYRPRWQYSCCLDNNNIFCLKFREPKENFKKKTIDFIYKLNSIYEKNEYIKPRMIKIIEKNDKISDEVFGQPWKYPNLFENS